MTHSVYADDILLLAQSVTALQKFYGSVSRKWTRQICLLMLKIVLYAYWCETRLGLAGESTADGRELVWADEIRYLSVFIVRATKFKCSVDHAKRSFYRAANSIYLPGLGD